MDDLMSDLSTTKLHHHQLPSENVMSTEVPTSSDISECYQSAVLEAVPSQLGQWLLISLYTLTSLAALVGNVTVIVVERVGSESAHAIRKYLINLAVSDITIGVLCVPFAYTDFMLGRWIFPHWLCPTAQFVQLLSVFVTSLTLTAIGVERYFATLHPFSRVHHWLESHTHIMLSLTWVLGAGYAYVPVMTTAAKPFELDNQTYYECSYDNNLTDTQRRLLMTTNLVLTFLLPLVVLIFSYSAIMFKLIEDQKRFSTGAGVVKLKLNPTNRRSSSSRETHNALATYHKSTTHNCECVITWPIVNGLPTDAHINPNTNTNHHHHLNNHHHHHHSSSFREDKTKTKINEEEEEEQKEKEVEKSQANQSSSKRLSRHLSFCTARSGGARQNLQSSNHLNMRRSTPINHRSKTIKMMFMVILLYGLCWMPIKVYQFCVDYHLIQFCTESQLHFFVTLYFACHWLAMANSFVNPIVYSFMSKSFRNDFRKITHSFRRTVTRTNTFNHYSMKTNSTQV